MNQARVSKASALGDVDDSDEVERIDESVRDLRRVWIYNDLPVGVVAGASLMASSWQRSLTEFGFSTRLFSPSGDLHAGRDAEYVRFRTLRHIGYAGDWHARFSVFAELRRAADELPDAIIIATPLRVGTLGLATAARYGIPLIVVHSSDTSTMAQYHGSIRAMASSGAKLVALEVISPVVRRAFWGWAGLTAAFRSRKDGGVIPVHGMKAIYSNADAIVVLGEKIRREVERWGIDTPVHTVPIGVDRLPFVDDERVRVQWPEDRLRLLYVGRFSREKNVLLPIRALRAALDRGVDAHLVLCGEGHMLREIDNLVERLDLRGHVDVIGPFARDELRPIFDSADVFVFPSKSDAQAMALNEAAHEALPIVGIDRFVNSVLVDGESGIVVDDDPYAMAEAFETMLDPAIRSRLGAKARELASATTEKSQLSELATVVHDAIRAGSRSGARIS